MVVYQRSALSTAVNGLIHNKIGLLPDVESTFNDALAEVIAEVPLRSFKRRAALAPNLFNGVYQYTCPTDMNGTAVIGLDRQTDDRPPSEEWSLVTQQFFDRWKTTKTGLLAFQDADMIRKLLASASISDQSTTIASLDSITANGTWAGFGDGTNLVTDTDNYVKGSGSIKWDINAAAGTTAGIVATDVDTYDVTDYMANGSAFVWAWVTSATNLTNFKLRLGSSSGDYYEFTVTTTNEGYAFATGWNLLRFSLSSHTTTGTPDEDAMDYIALYMTKTAGKVSEVDYRFDHIILKRGKIYNVLYYSKYPWQNSSGTYLERSTDDSDYLNVDTDEWPIIVQKCAYWAALAAREYDDAKIAENKYNELVNGDINKGIMGYRATFPSEALILTDTYYELETTQQQWVA